MRNELGPGDLVYLSTNDGEYSLCDILYLHDAGQWRMTGHHCNLPVASVGLILEASDSFFVILVSGRVLLSWARVWVRLSTLDGAIHA